ncbi:MAG: response regulator [Bradymonadales bacterium]|nr:response regulator [Bradymonadales bacterium]
MSQEDPPLILIADDDPDIRRILSAQLASMQCNLIESVDGESTLEQVIIHKPDLVILDVMMPELNGWEICKYIKTHEEYQHTGVIILTAIGATVNELTSPIYGADDYIDKPFEFEELEFKIKKVLSEKKKSRLAQRDNVEV